MRVPFRLCFVALLLTAIGFGASCKLSWSRVHKDPAPNPSGAVLNATRPFLPPSLSLESETTPSRPWSPHLSPLPTVVSGETGLWKPLRAKQRKHPCLPDLGQAAISRPGVRYHSSDLEREWVTKSKHLKICSTARAQRRAVLRWLNYSADIFQNTQSRPYREPSRSEAETLSAFESQGEIQYIEPLHGTARRPDLCDHLKNVRYNQGPGLKSMSIFDISYIIPANLCGRPGPKPRSKYFDLGATWNGKRGTTEKWRNFNYSRRGAAGVQSIPLFRNMYRDRCVDFDEIYAWEAKRYKTEAWFDPIPPEIRPKVHFFNFPVKEKPCPQSPSGDYAQERSFLRFLAATATVEDFVVVKVDIDGGPELEIVEAIAHRYELSRLVDELYFEYHFQFDDKDFGWGPSKQNWQGKTIDTAISLMYRLRQAGIRSHFWI